MVKQFSFFIALFLVTESFAGVGQSALPGILHTIASERMGPWGTNIAAQSWRIFDNDQYFQNDQISTPSNTYRVDNLFSLSNYVALALGLPGGVSLSMTMPIYYEKTSFAGDDHPGLYLGDARLKATWVLPQQKWVHWLSGLAGVGINLGTSTTGQGYVVRELEYAFAQEGCYLYSCGSRNTGLQFTNLEFRLGTTADFSKAIPNKPKIHINYFYHLTGLFSPGIGPYKVHNDDVYDIQGMTLAGEILLWYNLFAFTEYRHEQRRNSDYEERADLHQISYGLLWNSPLGFGFQGGVSHGIFNDKYAQGRYATSEGNDVATYGFKTPDLQFFTGATWTIF
jgi:hypothetical protein